MKVCHTEAMKQIKELEIQKKTLLYNEDARCTVSYREGEDKLSANYDYAQTRKKIREIDKRVRSIKHALAVANCKINVDAFDVTIGEALVLLAQLRAEESQLDDLTDRNQLSRRITQNGVIEFTECVYDLETVENDLAELRKKISALQIAIDRANLTNEIEI